MKRSAGFTLVELLIVVIIIGILATMAIPQYNKIVNRSRLAEGITMMGAILTGSQLYYIQAGGADVPSGLNTSHLDVDMISTWSTVADTDWVHSGTTFNWKIEQTANGNLEVRGSLDGSTGAKTIESSTDNGGTWF